jgi:hypothetical protein
VVMTVPRDATSAPLAPVIATLRAIEERHGGAPVHGLARGLTAVDPRDWIPAADLVSGRRIPEFLDAAKQRWNAQPHAAAALAWKCYTYWSALPALVGFAGSRRVPLPDPGAVLVRFATTQPFLTMALRRPTVAVLATDPIARSGDPDILVCRDDAELLGHLRRVLIDEHLTPLMERLRGDVHIGKRPLWGSLASGAAHALSRTADAIWPAWPPVTGAAGPGASHRAEPGPLIELIEEVLGALGVADLVTLETDPQTGALSIQRRTCCLAFTLPTPKVCSGCCIR